MKDPTGLASNNRKVLFPSSGGQKADINVSAELVTSGESDLESTPLSWLLVLPAILGLWQRDVTPVTASVLT